MNKYEVRFIEYGVEFSSDKMIERLAETLVRKLTARGIVTANKVKDSSRF